MAVDGSRVLVVIPARFASTRLPAKPLLDRTGKYLIQHVWERADQIPCVDEIVVATDDQRIVEAVESFGGEAVMTSPDCQTGSDRVAEVAAARDEELVVNLQGDEPEFDPADVDRLVRALAADPSLPMATLAAVAGSEDDLHSDSVVKVVVDRNGQALYFSRAPIPYHRDPSPDGVPPGLRHLGIYAFRSEAVQAFAELESTPLERAERLEQLRALENGWSIRVVTAGTAHAGIDTPEDYEAFCRRVAEETGSA